MVGKHKLGAKAGKYKGARVGKYKLGARARVGKYKYRARAGKYKLGARTGDQAKGRGPRNTNTLLRKVSDQRTDRQTDESDVIGRCPTNLERSNIKLAQGD